MRSVRFQFMIAAAVFFCCVFPFLFAEPAAAYTSNVVLSAPTVQSGTTAELGTLYIGESYAMSLKAQDALSISLPTCVELKEIKIIGVMTYSATTNVTLDKAARQFTVNGAVYSYGDFSQKLVIPATSTGTGSSGSFSVQVTDDNRFAIRIEQGATAAYKFYVSFPSAYIKPLSPDDPSTITATLDAPPGSGFTIPSRAPVIANVAVGGTTASVDAPYASSDGQPIVPVLGETGGEVATIIIKENVPGALKAGGGTVELALDPGFTWRNVSVIPDWGFNPGDVSYAVDNSTDASGHSVIKLTIINSTSSRAGRITVTGSVDVDEDIAQPGAVMVNYQGTNPGVDAASLTVARYNVSGLTVSEETTTDVIAGRLDQRIGQLSFQEQTPGDFPQGRVVTLTLPSGAKWNRYPETIAKEAGDGVLDFLSINSDKDVLRYRVTRASNTRSSFIFKYASVDLALQVPDELTVTVGGSAGASGTVTVANIRRPITMTADKVAVKCGLPDQSIGELTIKEERAGALRAKDASGKGALLTLKLPSGVTFSETPKVVVSEGNLSLVNSGVSLDSSGRTLTIPINKSSTTPSTIKISEAQVILDRTVPEGDLKLEIGGTAISETLDQFQDSFNKMDLIIASCVTPTSNSITGTAVFKIDESSYNINGREVAMDTAPYIKNGRTMIPLRFAANAVGITDDNIIWDGGTGTVTLIKGGRVVQMQIGNSILKVNGASIPNDVAPEISGGRTMVPIRALSTALGASVEWNESEKTVTITLG